MPGAGRDGGDPRLYDRDHLDQVLATFALILIFSEARAGRSAPSRSISTSPRRSRGRSPCPAASSTRSTGWRIIAPGWRSRWGSSADLPHPDRHPDPRGRERPRDDRGARRRHLALYTIVFALGAALAGLAGALVGAIQSVQVGMGEPVLILAFVVIVIGGIGSIKGALVGALLVGLTDTLAGIFLPALFKLFMDPASGHAVGRGAGVDGDLHPDGGGADLAPDRPVTAARL
jgi:branched-chain amino acid transport system permease protein